jgi:tetratricopeptide (TPR) repeat protein
MLPLIGHLTYKEYTYVKLRSSVEEKGCNAENLPSLVTDTYLGFRVMRELLPICTMDEGFLKDQELIKQYLPFYKKIAEVQGTHSQWFNLALVYRNMEDYAQAENALKMSVERQPIFEQGWAALHVLHIEEASRKTGRPIEDFLPQQKTVSADYYDSIFKRP